MASSQMTTEELLRVLGSVEEDEEFSDATSIYEDDLEIPLITSDKFMTYKNIPLPTPHDDSHNTFALIQPSNSYIELSDDRMHYAMLDTLDKCASETYKSRWFAFDSLKFLDNRNKPRKRTNTEAVKQPINEENLQNEFATPRTRLSDPFARISETDMKPHKSVTESEIEHFLNVPSGSEDEVSDGDSDDDLIKLSDLVMDGIEKTPQLLQDNFLNEIVHDFPSTSQLQPSVSGHQPIPGSINVGYNKTVIGTFSANYFFSSSCQCQFKD
ncbi:hypothetical protein PYW07_006636 [Mythimna separata]|uniref:Uncharacterized protein n=1 Tax=Mythimna separata TaxID=271217 RepID=A0AAD7YX34_MYTSE|nr:hypothetical protein PYW07_006636 [Mythimna separata]